MRKLSNSLRVLLCRVAVAPPPPPPPPHVPFLSCSIRLQHAAASESDDGRGPFSEQVLRLRDDIANLTDEELTQMSASLRKKLGLPEPPPMDAAALSAMQGMQEWQDGAEAGSAQAPEEKPPEKTAFNVKIEKFEAASKIKVIKEVRAVTELGLKEAKEFVEKVPAVLKTGLTKEEAEKIVQKLVAVGATAVVE